MKIVIIFFIIIQFDLYKQNSINSEIIIINENNKKDKDFQQTKTKNYYKKNVILSIMVKYSWEKALPFLKSLIKVNLQNCDIVIFVGEIKNSIINNLKSFGIIVKKIPQTYKNFGIYNYRWKIYMDFLNENREKYEFVLSADIKDTIIQNDIFNLYQNYEKFLGLSYEASTLNEGVNKKWILETFGKEIHKKIRHEKIINAGIIWGKINEFFIFCQILWKNILIYPKTVDQCIINYLIYIEHICKDYIFISDNYGPVITIALTKRNFINLDSETNINTNL